MTSAQKKALILTTNTAMTVICLYSFVNRKAEEYRQPSLANFMISGAFLFIQIGTCLVMKSIRDADIAAENRPNIIPEVWVDRVQENSNIRSMV